MNREKVKSMNKKRDIFRAVLQATGGFEDKELHDLVEKAVHWNSSPLDFYKLEEYMDKNNIGVKNESSA